MTAPARPLYLDLEAGPVFAMYHAPAATPGADKAAVILCPPFAWDDVASYRPRRDWAEWLAERGHPTLRFDWPGTGDSGGSPRDPGLVESWTQALIAAGAWLRAESGGRRLALVGLGLGGLVAWRAVAGEMAVDDLALWAVPARGRGFVRELKAFGRLQASADDPPAPEAMPAGGIQAGGFLFTSETLDAVSALDVAAMPLTGDPAPRILVLDRDGLAPDDRLREAAAASGADVTVDAGPGYGPMTSGPLDAVPPLEVFARVEQWLEQPAPVAPAAAPPAGEPVPATATATVATEGGDVLETPFTVELGSGRLFGVLTERAGARDAAGEAPPVCAVLLNAGAMRRVGPNRMWVEIARRWAVRGVPTVRLDLEGIGDADGDASRYADVSQLYVPEFVGQVRGALDALEARGLPGRFIVGGLCSGAYWSFHAALQDERVRTAVLLNPQVLFWDLSVQVSRDARRARELLRPGTWLRLLRGGFPARRALAVAGSLFREVPRLLARKLLRRTDEPAAGDELLDALDTLEATGRHVVLLFGEKEPLRDELEADGRMTDIAARDGVDLRFIPSDAHTLGPVWVQALVHEHVDHALARELAAEGVRPRVA